MGSSTSAATEDPERRRKDAASFRTGSPMRPSTTSRGPPGSLAPRRGPADRAADGYAGRDVFLLRGVLAPRRSARR